MSRFTYDPTKVSATISVLPKDDYEVILGDPRAYTQDINNGPQAGMRKFGIRVPMTVSGGEQDGKPIFFSGELFVGQDAETAQPSQFANAMKSLQLAAFGYSRDEQGEAQFNADHANDDWDFNPENGAVGEGWQAMRGKRVIVSLDINVQGDRQFQKFVGFRSLAQG